MTTDANDPTDPYTEPENSTVDDWHGQDVDRDIEAAERAVERAGGDPEVAEEIFDAERPTHRGDRFDVAAEDRPGTLTTPPDED